MALKKVNYIDEETVIEAENLNDIQDSIIALEDGVVACTASGNAISIIDSSSNKLLGLSIYGKSTQAGTPTPAVPVDIVSVGDDGEVVVDSGGERFALTLADGLRGIPVKDKIMATYTDSKGQMWYADEVDLARGVHIRRIGTDVFTGNETWSQSTKYLGSFWCNPSELMILSTYVYCTHAAWVDDVQKYAIGKCIAETSLSLWIGDEVTFPDIATWKTYLATQHKNGTPVSVHYPLAAPIETPLTAEEIAAYKALHTNKPNTTIINDENAYMTVKYIADTKSYIDNKVASAILTATVE